MSGENEALKLYRAADEARKKARDRRRGVNECEYWRRQEAKYRELAQKAEAEENQMWP